MEVAKDLQDAEDACTTNKVQNCTANLDVFGQSSIILAISHRNLRQTKIRIVLQIYMSSASRPLPLPSAIGT
jgi:hypothetical protein